MPFLKLCWLFASLGGMLAVICGAFGAHALKEKLTPVMLGAWQTAVSYQFYHVFALLIIGVLLHMGWQSRWLMFAAMAFMVGIVLFCGSLYWLSLGGPRWLGPVTPMGGLAFIFGWLMLMFALLQLSPAPR